MRRLALLFLPLVLTAAVPAVAQQAPPARVGRVSFVLGNLAFHMKGETQWSAAAVNYPVATGGSFWTDPKSRAELTIGAQTVDLANNTQVEITQLDTQVIKLAVPQGRVNLHLRDLGQGNTVEIDIPRGGIWLLQSGIYDIDAGNPSQAARVSVFDGSARFVGGAVDLGIKAGDVAVINGATTLTASLEHVAPDEFAKWCRGRDYNPGQLASSKYVSPATTGYEVLDEYGTWKAVPQYGEVWYPNGVSSEWVPYREGRWVWVEPWGWNWVDSEPWGFAPFHYGRWAWVDNAWGWVPGMWVPQPVYAPALVAFVDNPAAILAAAFAGPAVGWFPLGPGEAYWPSYTSDHRYLAAINAGAVADAAHLGVRPTAAAFAARAFVNRGGATVVPRSTFANAGRVGPAVLRVSDTAARGARAMAGAPAIRGAATNVSGMHGARAAIAAGTGGAAAIAGARIGREGFAGHGVPGISAMHGASRMAGMGQSHFAEARAAHMGAGHFAGRTFARGAPHFAGSRFGHMAMGHSAAHRFGGAHFSGGPHFVGAHISGGPHFGGGARFGGAPHFGGGGHFGGAGHFGGGHAPAGGPHIGAGGGGGGHGKH